MAVIVKRIGYTPSTLSSGGGSSTATRYLLSFNANSSWTLVGDDYRISIASTTHGKGLNPQVTVYMDNTVTFEEVIVPITINAFGDVVIYVPASPDNRFVGKLIII